MNTYFSHETAVAFWRTSWPADQPAPSPARSVRPQSYASKLADVKAAAPELGLASAPEPACRASPDPVAAAEPGRRMSPSPTASPEVLHVVSFDAGRRTHSRGHRCHLWSGPLPTGAFCVVGETARVASPEFTFLLMAQELTFSQLVAYGLELCGRYAFDEAAQRRFRDRATPLTSADAIRTFLGGASGSPGVKAARAAARYLADGSRSPRETACWMFASLPVMRGGYAVRDLRFNVRIDLTEDAALMARRDHCVADMLSRDGRVDVEYDGDEDHSGEAAKRRDTARDNALRLMGIETIRISSGELSSLQAFENVMLGIKRRFNERIAPAMLGATPARLELQRCVFEWNYLGGWPGTR